MSELEKKIADYLDVGFVRVVGCLKCHYIIKIKNEERLILKDLILGNLR